MTLAMNTPGPLRSWWQHLGLALLCSAAASCFGAEAETRARIRLVDDDSGQVHVRSLVIDEVPSPMSSGSDGASWENPAAFVFAHGHFKSLNDLHLHEIRFDLDHRENGASVLTVTLPRGPEVSWPQALSTGNAAKRAAAGLCIDPDHGRAVGAEVALELQLPREVVSQGVRRGVSGVSSSSDGNGAMLQMKTDIALAPGPDLIWIITF